MNNKSKILLNNVCCYYKDLNYNLSKEKILIILMILVVLEIIEIVEAIVIIIVMTEIYNLIEYETKLYSFICA